MKVLLIYYSFTGQAERAVRSAEEALRGDGHELAIVRVEIADPALRLRRPMTMGLFAEWSKRAWNRVIVPTVTDNDAALAERHDLVILFTNSWVWSPCTPIQSFLATPAARGLLDGTKVAIAVICRGYWRRNLRITCELVKRLGGRVIGSGHFTHNPAQLRSFIQVVRHMLTTTDQTHWGPIRLPRFGLTGESMARIPPFARAMVATAEAQP